MPMRTGLQLKKLPLHTKILLGLILGAIFGGIFSVPRTTLIITSQPKVDEAQIRSDGKNQKTVVKDWHEFIVINAMTGEQLARFSATEQSKILSYARTSASFTKGSLAVRVINAIVNGHAQHEVTFQNVLSIEKPSTIATTIKPVGTLFVRLLTFIAIPLVLASLTVGAASLKDIKKIGRIGGKTLLYYCMTIVFAITIGLLSVNLVKPGARLSPDARERLSTEYQEEISKKIQEKESVNLIDTIINIVPTNPIRALANGDMLAIVFFAITLGITLTMVSEARAAPVISFFSGLSDAMIALVELVMKLAPYGVFALIAAVVADFGFDILQTLAWYAGTVVVALLVHQFFVLGSIVRLFSRISPFKFFKAMQDPMLIAFTTSSSAATLPVNMETCEKKLGVPKEITSFVLPLGATINMDGTALYQAVAAMFIAQVYGIDVGISGQLTILLTSLLASIGTAPVPGVGIIMLVIVLRSVGIPEEGVALILGIDRFLDMCRTVPNITGDAVVSTIIARSEGMLQPVSK